jgi:hypothetical protein
MNKKILSFLSLSLLLPSLAQAAIYPYPVRSAMVLAIPDAKTVFVSENGKKRKINLDQVQDVSEVKKGNMIAFYDPSDKPLPDPIDTSKWDWSQFKDAPLIPDTKTDAKVNTSAPAPKK